MAHKVNKSKMSPEEAKSTIKWLREKNPRYFAIMQAQGFDPCCLDKKKGNSSGKRELPEGYRPYDADVHGI